MPRTLLLLGLTLFASAAVARPTGPDVREITAEWKSCVGANLRRVHADPQRTFSRDERSPAHEYANLTVRRLNQALAGTRSLTIEQGLLLAQMWDIDPGWLLCFDQLRVAFGDDYDVLRAQRFALNKFAYGVAEYALELPAHRRTDERSPYASAGAAAAVDAQDHVRANVVPDAYEDLEAAWRQTVGERLSTAIADAALPHRGRGRAITDATGLSPSFVNLLRTGVRSMSFAHAERLGAFLRVERDWLLAFDYVARAQTADPEALAQTWRRLATHKRSSNFSKVVAYGLTKRAVESQLWATVLTNDGGCDSMLANVTAEELAAAIIHRLIMTPTAQPYPRRNAPRPRAWGVRARATRPWEPSAYDVIRKIWIW